MTHGDTLAMTVAATHRSLEERLGEATSPHRDRSRPRDAQAAADMFLAATSRHLAAVEEVLVGEVRRVVPRSEKLVADYLEAARDLEQILSLVNERDKAPNNLLIAQAVRSCADRGIEYLWYANFDYGTSIDSGLRGRRLVTTVSASSSRVTTVCSLPSDIRTRSDTGNRKIPSVWATRASSWNFPSVRG